MIVTPSDSFTRPGNTTAYAAGDLVANSTTAGSVVPLAFPVSRFGVGAGAIRRARLFKDDETSTAADFILHLWWQSPTSTVGDNAAFNPSQSGTYTVSTMRYYLGAVQIDLGTSPVLTSTDAIQTAAVSPVINFDLRGVNASERRVYGLIEANDAYNPASGELFEVTLEISSDY